jgi:4-hydroxybenzoate polyprenyltransferase
MFLATTIAMINRPDPTSAVADAVKGHWAERILPEAAKPYARLMRLERPIGWWLLLWPCWWSTALAAIAGGRTWPDPWHLLLFFVGAIVMRGAGCTYNDIVDRDIDASVARTRSRPIPSGQLSVTAAKVFMVALSLIGFIVLIQFNAFAIGLGIASLGVVAIYPFMKRITDWPQVVLGFAFSWGALMGWAGAFGGLAGAPLALYVGAVLWTVGYDTIYAMQDKEDDAIVGVRSTARLFGPRARTWVAVFYAGAVAAFGLSIYLAGGGAAAALGLAAFAAHLMMQVRSLDPDNPERALTVFRSNQYAGWLLFAGLVADAVLQSYS